MGNINITDKAISKIQEVLASQGMKYFRIKVKGGGCSGFQYIFKSDNQLNSEKDIIKIIDFLGRGVEERKNIPLFYIYDDGTVEKRIIID